MAEDTSGAASMDSDPVIWRGRWASALALGAAVILVGLLGLVNLSGQDRDAALGLERNTYEVMHLARSVDASLGRSEAAMGRYVLDESQASGTQYYQEWRLAARQITQLRSLVSGDPESVHRAGVSVRGETINEDTLADPEDALNYAAWDLMVERGR